VYNADLLLASLDGVLESKSKNALRCLLGDELDTLNDAVNHDVFNTGVLAFGVLTDKNGVDVVVRSLVANNRSARTEIGE